MYKRRKVRIDRYTVDDECSENWTDVVHERKDKLKNFQILFRPEIQTFNMTIVPHLKKLYVVRCDLKYIPKNWISNLKQLKCLHLNSNNIHFLPSNINEWTELEELNLTDNPVMTWFKDKRMRSSQCRTKTQRTLEYAHEIFSVIEKRRTVLLHFMLQRPLGKDITPIIAKMMWKEWNKEL